MPLLTLKRHSSEYQEKSFGGPSKISALRNRLCSLHRLCATTPEVKLEALSREFCTGTPWELFYADDLVIIAETEDELNLKLRKTKQSQDHEKHEKNQNHG